MELLIFAVASAAAAAGAVAAAVVYGRQSRWLDRLEARTAVVHLVGGKSIAGRVLNVRRDVLVMVNASWLRPEGPVPVDGHVLIPRPQVEWVQRDVEVPK